jgi:flavin-dependent dehydrogenase
MAGGELRARLVIGADGLRSVVARRLGLARVARRPRRVALVTHVRGLAGLGDVGEMHVDAEGYTGLARVGADEANVAVVVPASRARDMHGDPDAFLRAWIAARPELARRFVGADQTSGVIATGPFASRARRAWAPGAALVGDSADFFDPFTGEGIYAALRGGEILATYAFDALRAPSPNAADVPLAAYDRWRRHEFGGKWLVERLVAAAVAWPPLLDRAAERLARRKDLADLLVGVTGDFVPAREVLRPGFIAALLFGGAATDAPSTSDTSTNTRPAAPVRPS